MTTVYCTVLARNYLAQALALRESFARHVPDGKLLIFLLDGAPADIPELADVEFVGPEILPISRREYEDLAAIYNIIEFATAVKPLVFRQLLARYEKVVYLDPDTWLVAPLDSVERTLDNQHLVLTPHFLRPIPPGTAYISEIHSLTLGIYNLGFCGLARGAEPFLDWWWSHLERECLIYPLMSLFVDQKWVDVGAQLFEAHSLRDPGVNVGPWNFFERHIAREDTGVYTVNGERNPLRLMHFSGFDPRQPRELSVRLGFSLETVGIQKDALEELAAAYATEVLRCRGWLAGRDDSYPFAQDQSGKRLTTRIRRAYRNALIRGESVPSPFDLSSASEFAAWRRHSVKDRLSYLAADAAIAAKYVLPDELKVIRGRLPSLAGRARSALLRASNIRR